MDRQEAVDAQVRSAHRAAAELAAVQVPRVDDWLGSASVAARQALDDLDQGVRGLRSAVDEWVRAARRAASHG